MLPDKQLFNNVPFQSTKYGKKELCVDNKVRETIGDVYCPACPKCVHTSTNEMTSFYDCKKCKTCCHVLNIPFRCQRLCCLAVMDYNALQERRVVTTKDHLHFWWNFSANNNQAHPNLFQKRTNRVQIWNKSMRFLLADDLSHIFNFQSNLFNFNLLLTSTQLTQKHHDLLSLQSSGLSILDPTLLLLLWMISTKI